ncbi:hypothetical protein ACHWQZ_G015698 [Mnemiopsis leidyi]
MGLYGKNRPISDSNSPHRNKSVSNARKTPNSTGKKPSSKSESDVLNVSSQKPLPSLSNKHRNKANCPCNQSLGSWKIDCSKCHQFWHVDCVGLKGINDTTINSLTEYLCPFCFVSPVPTIETTVDVCHICRNTLSLQQTNLAYESSTAANNLESLSQFCASLGSLDMDSLTKNMDTLSQFDSRLKHIILKENSLIGLDTEIKTLSNLLSEHKQHNESHLVTAASNNQSLSTCITELQHNIQLLQQPLPQSPLGSSDELLKVISDKLEKLCRDETDITTSLEHLKESLAVRSTEHEHQQLARPYETIPTQSVPEPAFPLHPSRIPPKVECSNPVPKVPHRQLPVIDSKQDFLNQAEADELKTFFDGCIFNSENGHSVCLFVCSPNRAGT